MNIQQKAPREHHWDALRAVLMLLGIPYHVAMAYRANDIWIVNAGEGERIFTWSSEFIHLFRMPLFFVVAGYFAALLLARRDPATWLIDRLRRLGVPLLVSLVTLVPILNLFCELSNFPLKAAIASLQQNGASSGGYLIRHLWFLIVLIELSAVAAFFCRRKPARARAMIPGWFDRGLARHLPLTLLIGGAVIGLWEAVAIELFYKAGLATNMPQSILRLDQLIEFTPWFILGWVIARSRALKDALHRVSPGAAVIALLFTAQHFLLAGQLHPATARFLDAIAVLALSQMLLALFKQIADRPHRWVQAVVPASFVIYLVHLPIAVALVVAAQSLAMPLMAKALAIMVLTTLFSWGAWLIVRASPTLRFLFDGVVTAAPPARPPLRLQPQS